MSHLPNATLRVAAVLAGSLLLAGCSGTPSRADFVAKTKDTVGSDLIVAMKARGVSASRSEQIVDDFLGCQYDSIKDDSSLLQKAYDDPSDTTITADLDARTTTCVAKLTAAMTEAADPLTTTTAPATSVPDTSAPVETVPATTAPDTSAPDTSAPDTTLPAYASTTIPPTTTG